MTNFETQYDLLPPYLQTVIRNEVSEKCEITVSQFYKLKNGATPLDRLRGQEVTKIFLRIFTDYRNLLDKEIETLKSYELDNA